MQKNPRSAGICESKVKLVEALPRYRVELAVLHQ